MRVLLASLAVIMLIGCAPIKYDTGFLVVTTVASDTHFIGTEGSIRQLIRYVDSDASVVCYMTFNGRGVFCLPLNDTKLR